MGKDRNQKQEERVREPESPAHKRRRKTKQSLNQIEYTFDVNELENLLDEDDVETFERRRKR